MNEKIPVWLVFRDKRRNDAVTFHIVRNFAPFGNIKQWSLSINSSACVRHGKPAFNGCMNDNCCGASYQKLNVCADGGNEYRRCRRGERLACEHQMLG